MSKVYSLHNRSFISEANDCFVCCLDGKNMPSTQLFYEQISQGLNFPDYFGENLDALDEMLYDLDWLEQERSLLLITNSESFLQQEPENKDAIIQLLEQIDNPYFEVCILS